MKNRFCLSIALILPLLSACSNDEPISNFKLPKGDVISGQIVFAEMHCIECHTLSGEQYVNELEEKISEQGSGSDSRKLFIEIGNKNTQIKTYAELVTSIINPSHKLADGYPIEEITIEGKSKMPNYNDILTVNELVDLVEFLYSQYELPSVPLIVYPNYQMPY